MAKMYISELALALSERAGIDRRDAQQFIAAMTETIQDGIVNDKVVKIKGLGTFKIVEVSARESVNVNTGERVTIDSHSKLSFVPDSSMKELVNKPFSQFETVVLNEGVTFDDVDTDNTGTREEEPEVPTVFDEDIIAPQVEQVALMEGPYTEQTAETEEPVAHEPETEVEEPVAQEPEVEVEEEPVVQESETGTEAEVEEEPVVQEPEAEESVIDGLKTATEEHDVYSVTPEPQSEVTESEVEQESSDDVEVEADTDVDAGTYAEGGSEDATVDDKDADENDEDADENDEKRNHSRKWLWIVLSIIACALCFFAGYYFGKRQASSVAKQPIQQQQAPTTTLTTDSLMEASTDTLTMDTTNTLVAEMPEETPVEEVQETKTEETEPEWKRYEDMDARVRTGAYHIIGLDRTVVVKQGETTARIARRTLGEGMECYIEVFNGIKASTPLQPGTEIKIPALQLKRAARQKLSQRQNAE